MRSPLPRVAAGAAFVASLACVLVAAPGIATATTLSPIDRACASDRLPREILDGPSAEPKMALRTIEVAAPAARLRLAVADDERTREFGLMCVTRLRAQHGMIFVFPSENAWEFWMKNTLVPLDMVWLTANGDVTAVAADVPAVTRATPEAALPRRQGRGLYVIELAANEASVDGIVVGAHLAVPPLHAVR